MDRKRNYKLKNYIGSGSFGRVYCVLNEHNEQFAMKEINWTRLSNNERLNLVSEISLQKCSYSPQIIKYYDSYIQDEYLYIISEYATQGDLVSYITQFPHKLTDSFIANTIIHIAIGLSYLHKHNIVHRDIKPTNIFIKEEGTAVIGDLGVSKFFPKSNLLNSLNGSPLCMSPEMCSGTGYNEKTDIWSLGCVLYYLLKGIYPYTGENILQLYYRIMNGSYEPVEDKIPHYREWNELLSKLLDKNPFSRSRASIICQEPFLVGISTWRIDDIQRRINSTNTIGENIWDLYHITVDKKTELTEEELHTAIQQIDNYSPKRTIELVETIPRLRLSPLLNPSSPEIISSRRRNTLPSISNTSTPRVESVRCRGSIYYEYKVSHSSARNE
jgi:serine/threonine protein kinase